VVAASSLSVSAASASSSSPQVSSPKSPLSSDASTSSLRKSTPHPLPEEISSLPPEGALLSEEFQLPDDLRLAIIQGLMDEETMLRLEKALGEPVIGRLVQASEGIRDRFLADPNFMFKLFADECVGVFAKVPAEYSKRGPKFWDEIDLVFTNVLMGMITEFLFTYTRAPTLSVSQFFPSKSLNKSPLVATIDSLPKNCFQRNRKGHEFSYAQRGGTLLFKGLQFFGTGIVSGIVGTMLSNALVTWREQQQEKEAEALAVEGALMATKLVPVERRGAGALPVLLVDASEEAAMELQMQKREKAGHDGAVESGAPAVGAKTGPMKIKKKPKTPVLKNTLAYSMFLATSSNTRYQLINGADRVLYDSLLPNNQGAARFLSVVVRYANKFWGSRQWVSFQDKMLGRN